VKFAGAEAEYAWRTHSVAATSGEVTPAMTAEAATKGWELVSLPESPEAGVPQRLTKLLKG
jgi:hypothetical protein